MRITFENGPSLNASFFVASEEGQEDMVVKASHILPPAVVTAIERINANEASKEEKEKELAALPVQPEQYVEYLEKTCSNQKSFHDTCLSLAVKNGDLKAVAQTQKVGKEPVKATEPGEKVKVGDEPQVAAESGYSPEKGPEMESRPGVRQYYQGLPPKSVGDPQRALDMQSSQDPNVRILAEELKKTQDDLSTAQGELAKRDKDKGLDEALETLTEIGAVEDAKDREGFKKDLGALDEKALGVVEKLLKRVRDAMAGKKPAAGPKPPAPVGATPPKPAAPPKVPAGLPAMSSQGNILQASLTPEPAPIQQSLAGMDPVQVLQGIWLRDDQKKTIFAMK